MPDLSDLLHRVVDPSDPTFDVDDVRARVSARARRRTLVGGGVMAGVVVLVALAVGVGMRSTPSEVTGLGDASPARQGDSRTFAGVELQVVRDASADAQSLVGHATLAGGGAVGVRLDGTAVSVIFECGEFGLIEIREADTTDGPRLPIGALGEAAGQEARRTGCVASPPQGTPDRSIYGAPSAEARAVGYVDHVGAALVAEMEIAGVDACCAVVPTEEQLFEALPSDASTFQAAAGRIEWGAVIDGRPLTFTADTLAWYPSALDPVRSLELAGGQVAASGAGPDIIALSCGWPETMQFALETGDLGRVNQLLTTIGCTPSVPPTLLPSAALTTLLDALAVEVTATVPEPPIARAAVTLLDGVQLLVRSGDLDEIGLPPEVRENATDPAAPLARIAGAGGMYGAVLQCGTIFHAIHADGEDGVDAAADLAQAMADHEDCGLDVAFGARAEVPTEPAVVDPDRTDPTTEGGGSMAAQLLTTVETNGLSLGERVIDDTSTSVTYTPPGAGMSAVWVSVAHEGVDPGWVVDGDTELVPLADGEAAVLPDSGMLAFGCDQASVTTTGPGAGGSDLESVAQFAIAAGCQPRPPGVPTSFTADDGSVLERWQSIREARVGAAIDQLGLVQCCGEPSHGGSGASTGFEWDGGPEVYVQAGPLRFTGPVPEPLTGVEVAVAGGVGRYVEADGLPTTAFDCGDTGYSLMLDSTDPDVHVAAAELLVSALACTPTTG